ncbi:hypothetical protein [Flavobacterium algicola]|uniref:hypothetical protein n=1 Tax=Flavobacterium algicola TaxID=556529 RepID=UPI001EFE24E3|nr:hypothetical protein [Flavobacterium algicola]MCG9794082.1 hypothetical protein [Flavobacterium algicola]
MKTIALILGFVLVSFSALAQEKSNVKQSDLKGPAYKNYRHGAHETTPTKIYSENNKTTLQGPAYKNANPAKNTLNQDLVEVKTTGSERQKLTGPAYKNYGPWSNKG